MIIIEEKKVEYERKCWYSIVVTFFIHLYSFFFFFNDEQYFTVSLYCVPGTTWTQEMVWCIAKDLDFEGAKQFLPERFPFLE